MGLGAPKKTERINLLSHPCRRRERKGIGPRSVGRFVGGRWAVRKPHAIVCATPMTVHGVNKYFCVLEGSSKHTR